MPRPPKNNADYFSHDAGMRDDPKIKAIRRKFSHSGYAVYCFLLEVLTHADFTRIQWDEMNIELLSGDFDIDSEVLTEIVAYMVKLDLFQLNEGFLKNHRLSNRLQTVFDKRNASKERFLSQKPAEIEVSAAEMRQKKGKEIKVKERKVEESNNRERAHALFFEIGKNEWNTVYTRKFPESTKTELNPIDEKALLKIADSLKKRMDQLGQKEWNETNAKFSFRKFFRLAAEFDEGDGWLQKNFELNTVERKFDKIVNPKPVTPTNGNSTNQPGERKVLFTESSIGVSIEAFQEYVDEIMWNGIDTDYYYSKFINHFVDEKNQRESEDFWKGRLKLWIEEDNKSKEGVRFKGKNNFFKEVMGTSEARVLALQALI